MIDRILPYSRKAIRVIKQEGLKSLYRKIARKAQFYNHHEISEETKHFAVSGEILHEPAEHARRWLRDNIKKINIPFYILLQYLVMLDDQLKNVANIACSDYKNYFKDHCIAKDLPFEIPFQTIVEEDSIIKYINQFDHAYLHKMIHSVFISLVRFLVSRTGSINLLDVGTGPHCGMFGEKGRFLFEKGRVNMDGINFIGIDYLFKPSGAIFKNSVYLRSDILSFTTDKKFDLITGHHVLEHCHNWRDIIEHISNLLNKGGYLYLSFPRLGGFYDTAYRLMSSGDHCATFDVDLLTRFAESIGMEACLLDIYVDPNNRFDWICDLYPNLVSKAMANCFYALCVAIDAKLLLGYHHYGHYVVFTKVA